MNTNIVHTIATVLLLLVSPTASLKATAILAEHQFSLANRYAVASVNEVFKKNILLNLAYLDGSVAKKQDINWDNVQKPLHTQFTLKPGETFAYHSNLLKEYQGKVALTTNAHFNASDGFVTDGYLFGDGVCHLASIMNWVAQDAGLKVVSPRNHDFAKIPEVPKEYGTSIYMDPNGGGSQSNLYITNTKNVAVIFHFVVENNELKVFVTEAA